MSLGLLPRRTLTIILPLVPALALIGWLVLAQLPRWMVPQPNWFAANTPGVCAAVGSLAIYQGQRGAVSGIGPLAAVTYAAQIVAEHYGVEPLELSEPLAVQANLSGEPRRALYLVTARLSSVGTQNTDAVIYLDAASGEVRGLMTTPEDASVRCDFDLRGALVAALRSLPLILLVAYVVLAAAVLTGGWLIQRKHHKGLLR